ncbi:hypothetical protein GEMRC1_008073 [Eukaryota sp. GEM-RC1]
MKIIMPFLHSLAEAGHESVATIDLTSSFSEVELISYCREYILNAVEDLESFNVSTADPSELSGDEKKVREAALPGSPSICLIR